MPNSSNVSGRLANGGILCTNVLGCEAVSGQGDVVLNSLLRTSRCLDHRALKLETTKLRVSF